MTLDPSRFLVQKLVIHEVPRRPASGQGGSPLILSDIESDLTTEIRNFFQEKIRTSLGLASLEVVYDPEMASPVPGLLQSCLARERAPSFIERSKGMAGHLYNCQTAVNTPGLLTVIEGTLAAQRSVAVLKLEKEEGVRVEQMRRSGQMTFSVEHLKSLMLTGRTRVFKVGLFTRSGDTSRSDHGLVSDNQRGYYATTGVADFFLRQFLGCKLRERPAVTTKNFFDATERFINEEIADPVEKTQLQTALLAELGSNRPVIHPQAFADNHLRVDQRQPYIDYISAASIPVREITKDNVLIAAHLKKIQMRFASGIAVVAPPDAFDRQLTVQPLQDGNTSVQIRDRLEDVKGRG